MTEGNWAGNVTYSAREVHRPASLDELRDLVVGADQVHVLGTRHSFNHVADAPTLVSLAALPDHIEIAPDGASVSLNPIVTYGRLAEALRPARLALHNLASLPHISVGGAVATGTHGSGDRFGNLATSVRALELLRSDGELVHLRQGDPDFDGAVVGLGALGAVVRITLAVEPTYHVVQHVHLGLPWSAVTDHFDAITSAGDSVSMFTTWGADVQQVWVKRRVPVGSSAAPALDDLFGARPAGVDQHPILGASAEHCTGQLGVPGVWSDRLPHFKMGFTPSSGDEIQSELHLPRSAAVEAIDVIRSFGAEIEPHLLVSEIRTVAADDLWLSSQHGRDTVAFHCTWRPHPEPVAALVARLEAALAHLDPRPHWGKVFAMEAATIAARFARHGDFLSLVERSDARGAFRTPWLTRHVLG